MKCLNVCGKDLVAVSVQCMLSLALIGAAFAADSIYSFGCGAVMLWLGAWRIVSYGRKKPKLTGAVLILASFGLAALSAAQMFSENTESAYMLAAIVICSLTAAQAAMIIYSLISCRKQSAAEAKFLRGFDTALLCVMLAAVVSRLLLFGAAEEWAQMTCLTGCVTAGVIFLTGLDMMLCAFCGFRTTRESIRMIHRYIRARRRTLHFVSVGKDCVMVFAKLVMSIVSFSFFIFSNALFSCGIGLARYTALQMKDKNKSEQRKLFRRAMLILAGSGLCYVIYSIRLFFGGSAGNYGMVMALSIACYTFAEFVLQIRELIKLKDSGDLEAKALRLISFSGIIVSFVLTQTAIMSFSQSGDHNVSDGIAGIVFGGIVVIVGLIALLGSRSYKNNFISGGLPWID